MAEFFNEKTKITLELDDGTLYELDAIATEISQKTDMIDVSSFTCGTECITGNTEIEMSFRGVGNITTELKKTMIVCIACGSEWHDAKYHPGTCANCGWGARDTKRQK